MKRHPKQIQDILDEYAHCITLEPGSKHLKVRINGECIAVYSGNARVKETTIPNSVARLKRELKKRNLWRGL